VKIASIGGGMEQSKDEQTGVVAAFSDQIGDSLNPLELFRVKRVIPQGSQGGYRSLGQGLSSDFPHG
jgi:hypothetical protein